MALILDGDTGVAATGSSIPMHPDAIAYLSNQLFPSGTKMMFVQTAAPTGWTKDTTHNNKALRVVSGTAGSGGNASFTDVFHPTRAISGSVGSTTLSTSQIPSHRHFVRGDTRTDSVGINFGGNGGTSTNMTPLSDGANSSTYTGALYGWYEGGGGSHNHTFSGTSLDMGVLYVDTIIATKD